MEERRRSLRTELTAELLMNRLDQEMDKGSDSCLRRDRAKREDGFEISIWSKICGYERAGFSAYSVVSDRRGI